MNDLTNLAEDTSIPPLAASPQHRIASWAVDLGLYLVTLGIGWWIWSFIVWRKGQSPAKSILKLKVLDAQSKLAANWGRMAVRQLVIPLVMTLFWLVPYVIWVSSEFRIKSPLGIWAFAFCVFVYLTVVVIDFVWMLTGEKRRLVDYWSRTIVVNESGK